MGKQMATTHHLRTSCGLGYDLRITSSECSAAWLAQLLWEQWVGGSNPSTPILSFLDSLFKPFGLQLLSGRLLCR